MLSIIPLFLLDICLAGYLQSFIISTVLPYFIIQTIYFPEHKFLPKIVLSALALIIESFIRYPYFDTTIALIFLSLFAAHYLNIELNSRRLACFLLLWLFISLQNSGLVLQALHAQTVPAFQFSSLLLELALDSLILAILQRLPGITKKNLIF